MTGNDVFEYAILRVVPRVEREEFLNVGIILYCAAQEYLHMAFELNEVRLRALSVNVDIPEIEQHLKMFEQICAGSPGAGSIGGLPAGERFRWLAAPRSTVVQTSQVHTGFCADAGKTLEHLLATLVRVPSVHT
jgi:Protein of unknown function (DUF3037)